VNYFEVFGLSRRLVIDTAALRKRFYELSRQWHPDFQHRAAPAEQARALEQSALVNAAYKALRDPIARVEYLIRLEEGRATKEGAAVKPQAPPDLLAEMFEIQEALQEAKAGGLDDAGRARLTEQRDALAARRSDEETRLIGPLSAAWDAADSAGRAAALEQLERALATRAYLGTVLEDLTTALEDDHVAHHRH
jgi:molecular chaperone HscB